MAGGEMPDLSARPRSLRLRAAIDGPNVFARRRTVSQVTSIPRRTQICGIAQAHCGTAIHAAISADSHFLHIALI